MTDVTRRFEQEIEFVRANVHRYSPDQRAHMIANCHPGFIALMQFEAKLAHEAKILASLDQTVVAVYEYPLDPNDLGRTK